MMTTDSSYSNKINWFPGHMAKTRRLISDNLKSVDIVIELLDSRIPYSSKNPEIAKLTENKPTLTLLNKSSLASQNSTKKWCEWYRDNEGYAIQIDCITGEGLNSIETAAKTILKDKLQSYENKGMAGRKLKAMILGIPNVGKSSLVNRLSGRKKAKVEDRPGVTLTKQWVQTNAGLDLLDMPGVLWPKFEDSVVAENLALTGAIRDQILDIEQIAVVLCGRLRKICPEMLCERYKLKEIENLSDFELFEEIGKKRGFLISGGEINSERTATMLLDEFRAAKIGRITLELPYAYAGL